VLTRDGRTAVENGPREVGTPDGYMSYLLRLWREGGESVGWRASLHDPRTGERMGFASVDELFGYLQRQMGTESGPDGDACG
jgi:hypothetical protein